MNQYLQKLHNLRAKKDAPLALTKLTKPQEEGSVSFVSNQSVGFFEPELRSNRISHEGANSENVIALAPTKLTKPCRILAALESRCPDLVPTDRWQRAVADGRAFLARWGDQAKAFGWTARDLFGLFLVPPHAKPSFSRLSRYEETSLIWLLRGREVVALTKDVAAIRNPTGSITVYRRDRKTALGPIGDSLDDIDPPFGGDAA